MKIYSFDKQEAIKMAQGRILYSKTESKIRPWHWVAGSFAAVAGAVAIYNVLVPDAPDDEGRAKVIAQPSAPKQSRETVWGQPSEMDSSGQQKPTSNMWGLLMRAENEADDAQNQRDIAFVKNSGIPPETCKMFWASRIRYDDFIASDNVETKLAILSNMDFRNHFFHATDKTDFSGVNTALRQMGPQALEELQAVMHNNSDDVIGNYSRKNYYDMIVQRVYPNTKVRYQLRRDVLDLPVMMHVYQDMKMILEQDVIHSDLPDYDMNKFWESWSFLRVGLKEPLIRSAFLQESRLTADEAQSVMDRAMEKLDTIAAKRRAEYYKCGEEYARNLGVPCPSPEAK